MNLLRFSLLSLGLCLLVGCQTLPPTFECSKGSTLIFAPSKWKYPASVAGFQRAEVLSYDRSGSDCSVAYNHSSMIAATVYVYPCNGRSLDQEVRGVSEVIEKCHNSGPALMRTTVSFSGRSGVRLGHCYPGLFAHQFQPLRSQTLLFRIDDRFLKFRITYPEARAEGAELAINSFLEQYPWP